MYRPLPDCLTIKESEIEGLGLFATKDIPAGSELGETHYYLHGIMIRTPLGGFYNHSDNPNSERVAKERIRPFDTERAIVYSYELITLKDIKAGEEITVKYTLYNPEENEN